MPLITTLIIIGFIGYYFYSKRITFGSKSVDYSFGDQDIQKIKSKIEEKEYTSAEYLIQQLNGDDLRQTIDHVTINGSENVLLQWKEDAPDSQIVDLFLGVYYMHQASINRGYGFAGEISGKQKDLFTDYSDQAVELLKKVDLDEVINVETYSRLVRILGSTGDHKGAQHYFEKCLDVDPKHLWAHIEYAEFSQPKWGGDMETTNQFIDDLTEEPLVNQVIYLKLVWDSVLSKENLFGGTMGDLKEQAKALLFEIDAEINNQPHSSIQRYVLYNYMTVVAEEFGIKVLNQKYNKLMNNYFTLYPFGIMK